MVYYLSSCALTYDSAHLDQHGGHERLEEEMVVIVYFASEGVRHRDIVELLKIQGFSSRILSGIRGKLSELRQQNSLGQPRPWNDEAVNEWLDATDVDKTIEAY